MNAELIFGCKKHIELQESLFQIIAGQEKTPGRQINT
jgi:hypothetical protein